MVEGLIGIKLGMTQIYSEDGTLIPVTVVKAGPCRVVQKKTLETDGYEAVQLAFKDVKEKRLTKPVLGHFRKYGVAPAKYIKEFKGDISSLEIGQEITVDIFKEGDLVDVTGTTKGKGFQGVVRRYGFAGGPASHGSMFHRAPGSIGSSAFPSRVRKNKRLPGHMGNKKRTVQNLEVVKIKKEEDLLLVKGALPGGRNSLVIVRKSKK